jgi:hypothetical protein
VLDDEELLGALEPEPWVVLPVELVDDAESPPEVLPAPLGSEEEPPGVPDAFAAAGAAPEVLPRLSVR